MQNDATGSGIIFHPRHTYSQCVFFRIVLDLSILPGYLDPPPNRLFGGIYGFRDLSSQIRTKHHVVRRYSCVQIFSDDPIRDKTVNVPDP